MGLQWECIHVPTFALHVAPPRVTNHGDGWLHQGQSLIAARQPTADEGTIRGQRTAAGVTVGQNDIPPASLVTLQMY